tara:strand:- start:383 stop:952 length:570 start_codon:yes stop_codon:yes gene_type:complete
MIFRFCFITSFILFFLSNSIYAKQNWILDKSLSTIKFEIPVFLYQSVIGDFKYIEGLVEIDLDNKKNNKAIFSVDINSININYPKYKNLLLSDIFFDVNQYPIALVDTKKFSYNKNKKLDLEVELLMKGIAKKIPLQINIEHLASKLVQIHGEFEFSRTTFNIGKGKWSSTVILKDKVLVKINLFLFKE